MEITGAIEPSLIVLAGHVDDECLAFPMPVRPTHPAVGGRFRRGAHVNDTNRAGVFVRHQNILLRLDDLKRVWQVSSTWYAREITLDLGVQLHPVQIVQ